MNGCGDQKIIMKVIKVFTHEAPKTDILTANKPHNDCFNFLPLQKLGSNYYQPMIDYIHTKNIQGVFFEKKPVQMAERAEVYSEKFNNK